MNSRLWWLFALLCSCGPLPAPGTESIGTGSKVLTAADPEAGSVSPPPPDGGAPLTGFPCEVRAVLQAHCARCHAGQSYAPVFLTRDALLGPASAAGMTVGEFARQRMSTGAKYPMPPYGSEVVSVAEVATVSDWVQAGMPAGACGKLTP